MKEWRKWNYFNYILVMRNTFGRFKSFNEGMKKKNYFNYILVIRNTSGRFKSFGGELKVLNKNNLILLNSSSARNLKVNKLIKTLLTQYLRHQLTTNWLLKMNFFYLYIHGEAITYKNQSNKIHKFECTSRL